MMAMQTPFEEIVTAHGATVLRVCRALLGPTEADDAWSETFLAALRAYPGLPADANVQAWLVTIAHRKAIDAVRAQTRRPTAVAEPPDGPSVLGQWQAPDDDLRSALAALPPRQRQAVTYHHVAGLPYAEVAAVMGGTPEAIRRAASDGIRTLRRTWAPTHEGSRA